MTKIEVDPRTPDQDKLWKEYWAKERVREPYKNALKLDEPIKPNKVRVVCISDTHNQLENIVNRIPHGDILVHCGDFSNNGEKSEILKFDKVMGMLPHKHKIVVAGNHELGFDDTENMELRQKKSRGLGTPKGYNLLKNCTILHDKAVEIYGINIYGSSWHPLSGYSFSCNRGEDLLKRWQKIPDNTDILLTHTPPLGHSDIFKDGQHWGCAELLNAIEYRVNPILHVFGHVHEQNVNRIQMAAHQPTPSSSSDSSTDLENIQGPLTLAQLVGEIEMITGSPVFILGTGIRKMLLIYRQNAQPPVVNPNLMVNDAVAQREAHAVEEAQDRTVANLAIGRHRVSPKRADRANNSIYFNAVCEDDESYTVSWHP